MTNLLIVESPNKAETIQSILGAAGWKVAASYGHIRDLPQRELGVDTDSFELQYELGDRGKKVVSYLRTLIKGADAVYLATDPDREGEAISWHLKDALGLAERDYWRVTFNAINEKTIKAAIAQPRKIDMGLVHAQEARRALDRLVGYMVSPVLWDRLGPTASAGRVQSPAVRAVVERENEIEAFRPTKHFGASVSFAGGAWSAAWDSRPFLQEGEEYNLDAGLAATAAACRTFRVQASETKEQREAPPAPFTTSTLLQAASAKLKFDPDKTAKLAQSLFEGVKGSDHGHISYHRTDSTNFSDESIAEIRQLAGELGMEVPEKPRRFKEKGDAQGAHEAIRPTDLSVREAGQTDDERALYKLIWERAIASQLADALYSVNTLDLVATDSERDFLFRARGRELVKSGWRAVTAIDATSESDDDAAEDDAAGGGSVPSLEQGSSIEAESGKVLNKVTVAPPRYTEAALVKKLEDLGIGRPSTYASIMKNIRDRGYVVIEKRKLLPTPLGRELIASLLTADFAFIEYGFTRNMEGELDVIAEGNGDYASVVSGAYQGLASDIGRVRSSGALPPRYPCPKCGKALRRVNGSQGVFWSCSGYRETGCDQVMDDKGGEPVERTSYPCPDCSAPMYRRKGKFGFYWGCSAFKESGCKCILPDERGKPGAKKAPAVHSEFNCTADGCGKPLIRRTGMSKARTVKGKKLAARPYDFYACSGYPKCDATYQTGSDGNPEL